MSDLIKIPNSTIEQLEMIENILISRATGAWHENGVNSNLYANLRRVLIADSALNDLLPQFVRKCRDLEAFWAYIKGKAGSYAGRSEFIREAFAPLFDQLEGQNAAPGDGIATDALKTFDADGVHAIWAKALARRHTDPEGAITLARTLLETVTKRILEESDKSYSDKDDLPKLFSSAAEALNLAPNQHSQEPIKSILGGAMSLVNGIGTLRNRLSDSHGRGGKLPVKPSQRHANLAVNTAGAIATFLVETYLDRVTKE